MRRSRVHSCKASSLECPPSFHTLNELEITEQWKSDEETKAVFAGMLTGAFGWDPSHNIPDNIQQSLDEAKARLKDSITV
jgi:hypothetical protein